MPNEDSERKKDNETKVSPVETEKSVARVVETKATDVITNGKETGPKVKVIDETKNSKTDLEVDNKTKSNSRKFHRSNEIKCNDLSYEPEGDRTPVSSTITNKKNNFAKKYNKTSLKKEASRIPSIYSKSQSRSEKAVYHPSLLPELQRNFSIINKKNGTSKNISNDSKHERPSKIPLPTTELPSIPLPTTELQNTKTKPANNLKIKGNVTIRDRIEHSKEQNIFEEMNQQNANKSLKSKKKGILAEDSKAHF